MTSELVAVGTHVEAEERGEHVLKIDVDTDPGSVDTDWVVLSENDVEVKTSVLVSVGVVTHDEDIVFAGELRPPIQEPQLSSKVRRNGAPQDLKRLGSRQEVEESRPRTASTANVKKWTQTNKVRHSKQRNEAFGAY